MMKAGRVLGNWVGVGLILTFVFACKPTQNDTISLDGVWQFMEDPDDLGIDENWFSKPFSDEITLPGSMRENGKGNDPDLNTPWTASIYDSSWYYNPRMEKYRQPGNMKFPFWLTPVKVYLGPAWYQKKVSIPVEWDKKHITLMLERPHWETTVWVDSALVDTQNSLSTAHIYDLSDQLSVGEHVLTIRVDNRRDKVDVGQDSHSLSDHTQGNWNGIVGELSLKQTDPFYIDDVQLYPNVKDKTVKALIAIGGANITDMVAGKISLSAELFNAEERQRLDPISIDFIRTSVDTIELTYPMGSDVKLWDEFNPALYRMTVTLLTDKGIKDEKQVQFGMREFAIDGTRFKINGRSVFLRGTLENCQFPLTGYPPTDEAAWVKVFETCRKSGLNHMRFHSFCPPEAAFYAADKMGFYLQPEAASWANHGTALGYGRPIDQYILDETERIIKQYGNHPSFCMWAYGNEPRGRYVKFLDDYLVYWKKKDARRVYTGASIGMSWDIVPQSEFLVRSGPRGLPFNRQPNSRFNYNHRIKDEFRPYVSHEMGQYCVFPNFEEISKYTGVHKARNFEMFQEDLGDHHMGDQSRDFLMASGKLQVLCYKAEIEAALRTKGLAGYQLLGLTDFPGQGSALVGMLDVFWDEKGYVTIDEINRFQSETVPLAEFDKFEFKNDEPLDVDVMIAHFGDKPLINTIPTWKITASDGSVLEQGEFQSRDIAIGNTSIVGTVLWDLDSVVTAAKFNLEVTVNQHSNDWDFWVYPRQLPVLPSSDLYVCTELNDSAKLLLSQGGRVLLNAAGKVQNGKNVVQYFKPVFWNTSWFKMRPPHTTGVLINSNHPLFDDFPTEYHSNYQWWALLERQQVMNLVNFPIGFRPIVQPIDTWFLNRRLGMIFEARVGSGKLLVCSAALNDQSENRPASRQMRYALEKYASSNRFNPAVDVEISVIEELFEVKERMEINLYTKDSPDELKPKRRKK